jgi:hypothetical protein
VVLFEEQEYSTSEKERVNQQELEKKEDLQTINIVFMKNIKGPSGPFFIRCNY